jgi:hypothetical protein
MIMEVYHYDYDYGIIKKTAPKSLDFVQFRPDSLLVRGFGVATGAAHFLGAATEQLLHLDSRVIWWGSSGFDRFFVVMWSPNSPSEW